MPTLPWQKDTCIIVDMRGSPKAMLQCDGWASWAAAAKRESALSLIVQCLPRPIQSKGVMKRVKRVRLVARAAMQSCHSRPPNPTSFFTCPLERPGQMANRSSTRRRDALTQQIDSQKSDRARQERHAVFTFPRKQKDIGKPDTSRYFHICSDIERICSYASL